MARYEVTAYVAQGNGVAFDHGDHLLDIGWEKGFETLAEALDFIRISKSGWTYTDDGRWMRRGIKEFYLREWSASFKHSVLHRFEATGAGQPNVEINNGRRRPL